MKTPSSLTQLVNKSLHPPTLYMLHARSGRDMSVSFKHKQHLGARQTGPATHRPRLAYHGGVWQPWCPLGRGGLQNNDWQPVRKLWIDGILSTLGGVESSRGDDLLRWQTDSETQTCRFTSVKGILLFTIHDNLPAGKTKKEDLKTLFFWVLGLSYSFLKNCVPVH